MKARRHKTLRIERRGRRTGKGGGKGGGTHSTAGAAGLGRALEAGTALRARVGMHGGTRSIYGIVSRKNI